LIRDKCILEFKKRYQPDNLGFMSALYEFNMQTKSHLPHFNDKNFVSSIFSNWPSKKINIKKIYISFYTK